MTFEEYQKLSRKTAIYPDIGNNFIYPTLGLAGEAGEVAEKIKKIWRDNNCQLNKTKKQEVSKELGDVLWYLSQLATELNLSLENIALFNLQKVNLRSQSNKISGAGDDREE